MTTSSTLTYPVEPKEDEAKSRNLFTVINIPHPLDGDLSVQETKIKPKPHEEPYTIFTTYQLARIVAITAFTATISPLSSSIYLPALNQIEKASLSLKFHS
jgi:hypothetical protein